MDAILNFSEPKPRDSKEIFALTFELLKTAEKKPELYERMARKNLAKQLIELYYVNFKTDYESMIYNFKRKYIKNEAVVEYNDEDELLELVGLGYMYDYIQAYKPGEDNFNIFIECMKLHKLLYKALDDKFVNEREKLRAEYNEQLEEAKKNKDIEAYKKTMLLMKGLSDSTASFGGNLRQSEVDLNGVDFHVPTAIDAKKFLNAFLDPEKRIEYQTVLSSYDIFLYIEYCIKVCVNIIKYQPFENGNKRTARALLNLMFKNRNIPPVYIVQKERGAYKDALIKAITEEDYTDIINFYYFKICDSIYELDIKPYIENNKKEESEGEASIKK